MPDKHDDNGGICSDEVDCNASHSSPSAEDWETIWEAGAGKGGERQITVVVQGCGKCDAWLRVYTSPEGKTPYEDQKVTKKRQVVTTGCATVVQFACVGGDSACKCKWKITSIDKC
jgi:hypothetical protein